MTVLAAFLSLSLSSSLSLTHTHIAICTHTLTLTQIMQFTAQLEVPHVLYMATECNITRGSCGNVQVCS